MYLQGVRKTCYTVDIYAVQLYHGSPYFIWQSHINNYVMINSTFKFKTFKCIYIMYSPDVRDFCEVLKIEAFIGHYAASCLTFQIL